MTPDVPGEGARTEAAPRSSRRAASCVIVAVLGLQFVTAFKLLCPPRQLESLARFRVLCSPALWPFTDYQMYGAAYAPPVEVTIHDPVGVLADGREVALTADALGMRSDEWRRLFVDAIRRWRAERVAAGVRRYEERSGEEVVRLRLIERRFELGEGGTIEAAAPRVEREVDVPDAGAGGGR